MIVDKGGKCEIYDLVYRRYVPIYSNIDSWSIHESLPLTQLNMADGSILLVDTKRHIFRPEEFTNYFRCLLNNDFPNVIKVALNEYIEKFVTYTLNAITEINQIGKYKASNAWYEFTNQKV